MTGGEFACINPACGMRLQAHLSCGSMPHSATAAGMAWATLCLYCGTVIAVGVDGTPRRPTPAERVAIEGTGAYRSAVLLRTVAAAGVRQWRARMN